MAGIDTTERNVALPVKNAVMVLSIVGAINWGLIALFDFDVVEWAAGRRHVANRGRHKASNVASRVIYGLVGLSGVVLALVPPLKQIEPVRKRISRPERTFDEMAH